MHISPFGHISFERLFADPTPLPLYTSVRRSIAQEDDTYTMDRKDDGTIVLRMNFAGYDKECIKVTFNKNTTTLTARVDEEHCQGETGNKKKAKKAQDASPSQESHMPPKDPYRRLYYTYRLNKHVTQENITTEYKNGLLTITITPPQRKDEEVVDISIN